MIERVKNLNALKQKYQRLSKADLKKLRGGDSGEFGTCTKVCTQCTGHCTS